MEMFHRILKTAVEGGASDVHIKIGTPVIFRINRQLVAIECPHPTEEWMNSIVKQISPAHLEQKLREEREADFSYFLPGIGRGLVPDEWAVAGLNVHNGQKLHDVCHNFLLLFF